MANTLTWCSTIITHLNISGYRHSHVPPPEAGSQLDDEAREQSEPDTILGDEGWPILKHGAQLSLLLFNISGYRHNHVSPPEAGSKLDDEAREQSEPATILGDEGGQYFNMVLNYHYSS